MTTPPTAPDAPLAARVRPTSLDEVIGHAEALEPVRKMLAAGRLPSLLLFGPPGVGKTTIASALAQHAGVELVTLSATASGVKDVRAAIDEADRHAQMFGTGTVLFIDEIHRFNKGQQDALLPGVEAGTVTLVGATTENPFFEINAPLLSRCRLVRLEPLTDADVATVVRRAIEHADGLAGAVTIDEPTLDLLVAVASGDARTALNMLEAAATIAADADTTVLTPDHVDESMTRLRYDRAGDQHYDQVSAFIKSLRGSDPDAAVYWLVRMLTAGEDPRFLARRMIIFASEDVGVADREALHTAIDAFDALERVGLPEARLNLAHAAIRLAVAPKSNSVTRALGEADRLVAQAPNAPIPSHLRDAHYKAAKKLGHGVGYDYPHAFPGGHVDQRYLPAELGDAQLYEPTTYGQERAIAERLASLWPDRDYPAGS